MRLLDLCSIQRLRRESTERPRVHARSQVQALAPFNGSEERALKVLNALGNPIRVIDCSIQRLRRESTERVAIRMLSKWRGDAPFNGSEERALKVLLGPDRTDGRCALHSTAQKREH